MKYAGLVMFTTSLLTLSFVHLQQVASSSIDMLSASGSRGGRAASRTRSCCTSRTVLAFAVAVISFVCAVRTQARVTQYVARVSSFVCRNQATLHVARLHQLRRFHDEVLKPRERWPFLKLGFTAQVIGKGWELCLRSQIPGHRARCLCATVASRPCVFVVITLKQQLCNV